MFSQYKHCFFFSFFSGIAKVNNAPCTYKKLLYLQIALGHYFLINYPSPYYQNKLI